MEVGRLQAEPLHDAGADLVGGKGRYVAAVGLRIAVVGAAEQRAGEDAVHPAAVDRAAEGEPVVAQACSLPPPEPGRTVRPKSLIISVVTFSSSPLARLVWSKAASALAISAICVSCVSQAEPRWLVCVSSPPHITRNTCRR